MLYLFLTLLLGGCGSKINEANYYRVHYGMTEEDVEEQLGPAHEESIMTPASVSPATTQGSTRKLKTWTRGRLVIRVEFKNGKVVKRSAEGGRFKG